MYKMELPRVARHVSLWKSLDRIFVAFIAAFYPVDCLQELIAIYTVLTHCETGNSAIPRTNDLGFLQLFSPFKLFSQCRVEIETPMPAMRSHGILDTATYYPHEIEWQLGKELYRLDVCVD
jgi:hypothetical protein